MFMPGPMELIIICAIIALFVVPVVLVVLVLYFNRRSQQPYDRSCPDCRQLLREEETHCPNCGRQM